jgi:hypothetical protein
MHHMGIKEGTPEGDFEGSNVCGDSIYIVPIYLWL